MAKIGAAHNARLRYIGHLDAVKPGLTVGEMLGYWRALRGVGFADVLDAFGLRGLVDRPVRSLSAGQKKRLSLTRLMMDDAPLWLLDEASASLDKEGQELLRAQIARHRGADGIVIAATHDEENIQDAQHFDDGCAVMKKFIALLHHEMRLQARQKSEWAGLLLFFVIIVILMPFALGPEPDILQRLAPGLIWLAALLMSLLSLDHLFVQDARDGTLNEMLTSPLPLTAVVFAKMLGQILVMLGVLGAMLLPASLLLGMDRHVLPTLLMTFVLGIPSLALLGGMAGAVTVILRRNAALLTLLLAPFYVPILIFAVAACDAAAMGGNVLQPLLFLASFLALILPVAPFIIAASLRHGQG